MGMMQGLSEQTAKDHVSALMAWWSLAGVETSVDEVSTDWTAHPNRRSASSMSTIGSATPYAPALPTTPNQFPDSLESFHLWLENAVGIPETDWTGPRILPSGPRAPRLMVILDMPDTPEGSATGSYLSGDADTLLNGMLRAIGLDRDAVYVAALAIRRPPGGIFPAEARGALMTRMQHHIALVSPAAALLLGDGTSRFLASADGVVTSGNLGVINHAGGTIAGVSTFHPRLMLSQPSAKMESWRALQKLAGVWTA